MAGGSQRWHTMRKLESDVPGALPGSHVPDGVRIRLDTDADQNSVSMRATMTRLFRHV